MSAWKMRGASIPCHRSFGRSRGAGPCWCSTQNLIAGRRSEEGIKPTLYLPRKRAEPWGSARRKRQGHMADVSKASRFIPSSNYPHSGEPADRRLFFRCLGFGFFSPAISRKILIFNEIWLGPESNRRHEDFQSSALPTELPSRKPSEGNRQ
jgi:hypothetical protein